MSNVSMDTGWCKKVVVKKFVQMNGCTDVSEPYASYLDHT